MNITTRTQDFESTEAIDGFVRRQLQDSLQRFSEGVISIDVFMKDTNGPRGGADKQVLIRVQMRNRQQLALETTHENLYAAIKSGIKRTKRAVRRNLKRSRRVERIRLRDLDLNDTLSTVAKT